MLDLNEYRIFSKVAQLSSFSAAAKSLNVPVSMVSRKISDLETRLGILLIKRTTRKLSLTAEGNFLYDKIQIQIQEIEDAEQHLTQNPQGIQGRLRVTAPVALGRGSFLNFISHFKNRHPEIEIELVITNSFIDLVTGAVDVAIRFGELPASNLIAKKLGFSQRILVASSEYLKKHGTPKSPSDLKNHQCLLFAGSGVTEESWSLINGSKKSHLKLKTFLSANNFETLFELTKQDLGIAFLPDFYLSEQKIPASLKNVLPQWTSSPIPVHALYLSRRLMSRKVEVFLSELHQWDSSLWQIHKRKQE